MGRKTAARGSEQQEAVAVGEVCRPRGGGGVSGRSWLSGLGLRHCPREGQKGSSSHGQCAEGLIKDGNNKEMHRRAVKFSCPGGRIVDYRTCKQLCTESPPVLTPVAFLCGLF